MTRMTDVVLPPTFEQTASFTPGPWRTDPEVEHQGALGPDDVLVADCSIFVNPKFGTRTDAINTANARLIAAAPELLAALRDALRSSRKDFRDGPEGDRQHREAYAEQFAAIAKAKAGAL